jgi:hypothetical protein
MRRAELARRDALRSVCTGRAALAVAACLLALSAAEPARACSRIGQPPFVIDPAQQSVDQVAPDAIAQIGVSIARGSVPRCSHGECTATSCDGVGSVFLELGPLHDDRTPSERMGVLLEVVEGQAPAGLMPSSALGAGPDGRLTLLWSDDLSTVGQPIDFKIVARAVDAAGNTGPPSEPVRIHHAGITVAQRNGTAPTCSAAPGADARGSALLACAAMLLVASFTVRRALARERGRAPVISTAACALPVRSSSAARASRCCSPTAATGSSRRPRLG